MGIFDFFRKREDSRLFGCWHLVRIDGPAHAPDEVELEFRRGGELIYSIRTDSNWKVERLRYRVDGAVVVSSGMGRQGYTFEPSGMLRLDAVDNCTWYEHGPKKAPAH